MLCWGRVSGFSYLFSLTFQTESGRMSQLEQDLHQMLYSVITPGLFHIRKTYAV